LYFNSIELLEKLEGFSNVAYIDAAGKKTIGIGHLLNAEELLTSKIRINGQHIDYSLGITKRQCYDLCMQDLERFCEAVDETIKVNLSRNQFDALVIFCYNVGIRSFKESTLVKLLNQGEYDNVPDQLLRWNKAGGVVVHGLTNRRKAEIKLWNTK